MLTDRTQILVTKQVAELIQRSEDWVIRARAVPKEGPPFYRVGGRIFYDRGDVVQWFEACRVE